MLNIWYKYRDICSYIKVNGFLFPLFCFPPFFLISTDICFTILKFVLPGGVQKFPVIDLCETICIQKVFLRRVKNEVWPPSSLFLATIFDCVWTLLDWNFSASTFDVMNTKLNHKNASLHITVIDACSFIFKHSKEKKKNVWLPWTN